MQATTSGACRLVYRVVNILSDHRRDAEFTAFVEASGAALSRAAFYLCGDADKAQDLVQVALTKTYVGWPAARRTDPYAYARRVLVNSNIDNWRRRRWREVSGADAELHAGPTAPDAIGQIADRQTLVAALLSLSLRERAVLVLRFFEDLSERDTAQVLGVGIGTVKSTTSRALAKLRLHPLLHQDDQEMDCAQH